MNTHGNRPFAAALLAFALAGCAVGPRYVAPTPAILGVPRAYGLPGETTPAADLPAWWRRFNDPELSRLIDTATAANLDISVSQARLRQAREQLIQSQASLLPSLTGSAQAGSTHVSAPVTTSTIGGFTVTSGGRSSSTRLSAGLDASWQADLFGGLRRSVEAARASRDAAVFQLAGTRTSVAAEVATNYIDARLAQARLGIAQDALKFQDDNLQIAGWRVQAGLAAATDVDQARAQRAQTAAGIPLIANAFTAAADRIGVLTGQAPSALRGELETAGPIPTAPGGIGVGTPVDTLRQRPDVRAAERNLAAATAQIGVSEAQLYPALTLPGSLTVGAARFGGPATITGQLFASLSQTIFDGGRLRSQVRASRAGAEAALATYKQTVLLGLEEVENALQALQSAQARQAALAVALDASNKAAVVARAQYRVGRTDFLTLLQSEQSLLAARDSLASAEADEALAVVRLYLALGGGWRPAAPDSVENTR